MLNNAPELDGVSRCGESALGEERRSGSHRELRALAGGYIHSNEKFGQCQPL